MLELEEKKKNETQLTELEKEKKEYDLMLINKAKRQNIDEFDEVKDMNRYMSYARTVTVRDRQLQEKKIIREKET